MVQDPILRYCESDDRRVEASRWSVRNGGGEAEKTYKSWGKGVIIACTVQPTSACVQLCSPDGIYARKCVVDGGLGMVHRPTDRPSQRGHDHSSTTRVEIFPVSSSRFWVGYEIYSRTTYKVYVFFDTNGMEWAFLLLLRLPHRSS